MVRDSWTPRGCISCNKYELRSPNDELSCIKCNRTCCRTCIDKYITFNYVIFLNRNIKFDIDNKFICSDCEKECQLCECCLYMTDIEIVGDHPMDPETYIERLPLDIKRLIGKMTGYFLKDWIIWIKK